MNTFIAQCRSRMKEPEIVDLRLSENLLESSSYFMRYKNPSPEEIFFGGLMDEDVRGALDNLHVDFKTVVWLSDVEGFSQKEIAEMQRSHLLSKTKTVKNKSSMAAACCL